MSVVQVFSRAIRAHNAPPVRVEVDLSPGLPCFTVVGLPDTEIKEARERVRSAVINSGLRFPHDRRITVNLAPADLPKHSSHFDLPMALGILAADGQVPSTALASYEFAAELSLNGELQGVRGSLVMALRLHEHNQHAHELRGLVIPQSALAEASWAGLSELWGVTHLNQVLDGLRRTPEEAQWQTATTQHPTAPPQHEISLDQIKGQVLAKQALVIAAAGQHSLLMNGPAGCGKTMLAHALWSLLPPMNPSEALASACLLSIAGQLHPERMGQRPWQAPHHSATAAALVGGGNPPRPGALSLAHHGLLFLDELTEFKRPVLEQLREPLETGQVHVSRGRHHDIFPAKSQLVAAMNPCPCGNWGHPLKSCWCTPEQVRRYRGRLSGPWLDRIDIGLSLEPWLGNEPLDENHLSQHEAVSKINDARQYALQRQGKPNAQLTVQELDRYAPLSANGMYMLHSLVQSQGLSMRRLHRIQRVARSQADLQGHANIETDDLSMAISLQKDLTVTNGGWPL